MQKREQLPRQIRRSDSATDTESEIDLGLIDTSTNTDTFSCKNKVSEDLDEELEVKLLSHSGSNVKDIILEKYYAVYEDTWYIGRILQCLDENSFLMKFLKSNLNTYFWLTTDDIAKVNSTFFMDQ